MKTRFPACRLGFRVAPHFAAKCVVVSCAMHNFATLHNVPQPDDAMEVNEEDEEEEEEEDAEPQQERPNVDERTIRAAGNAKRDHICDLYF